MMAMLHRLSLVRITLHSFSRLRCNLRPSLIYAGIAAPLTALFGLLIAYIVVRKDFQGKKSLEFLTMLCFAVPGTVAGVSYILAFNNAPPTF